MAYIREVFLADMGEKPRRGLTIERRDNDRGYQPDNCCWASSRQQANNRRVNRYLMVDGVRLTMTMAAEQYGIPEVGRFRARLNLGWSKVERALSEPHRDAWGVPRAGRVRL